MNNQQIIEHLKKNNPYPADVFTEPTKDEWEGAAQVMQDAGIVPDRIFGKWGRMVWENCTNQLAELLKEQEEISEPKLYPYPTIIEPIKGSMQYAVMGQDGSVGVELHRGTYTQCNEWQLKYCKQ